MNGFRTGPVILDAEALSRTIGHDAYLRSVIRAARDNMTLVVVASTTIVEVAHPRINRDALAWTLSSLTVHEVTKHTALLAANLLRDAGRHGHRHALDALMCASALERGGHPTIFTSDPDDVTALIGSRASVVPLR